MAATLKSETLNRTRRPNGRSHERQALAAACERLNTAKHEALVVRHTIDKASDNVRRASGIVEDCNVVLATAKSQATSNATEALKRGQTPQADSGLLDARARLATATEELEVARAVLLKVEQDVAPAEAEVLQASEAAEAAALQVIAAEVDPRGLLKAAQELQARLVELRLVLRWLLGRKVAHQDGVVTNFETVPVLNTAEPIAQEIKIFLEQDLRVAIPSLSYTPFKHEQEWKAHANSWAAVIEQLMGNADAELPTIRR